MKYLVAQLTPDTYGIAMKDTTTWDVPSYTNLYVIKRQEQVILIDAGLRQYQPAIWGAFAEIGIDSEQVSHILFTHGHHDHVDGASMFPKAVSYIHTADRSMVAPTVTSKLLAYEPGAGAVMLAEGVADIDIIHVNTHSPGSVVIFDHQAKIMFAGDFFCFWGEMLPEGELVAFSEMSRNGSYQYVADQAASGGIDFERFMSGLTKLLSYQPEYFCTGHGVILHKDIHNFLRGLWESGQKRNK